MDRKRLLIADENEEFRNALSDALCSLYQIRCCENGKDTLSMLHCFLPDILVLDLMLPELDGISLLEETIAGGLTPMVLATTRYTSPYIVDSLSRLGVDYLMMKPCSIQATVTRIQDLQKRISPDWTTQISHLLTSMSFAPHLHGYTYLLEIISIAILKPDIPYLSSIYSTISEKYGVTVKSIERAIRNAIEAVWSIRDKEIWKFHFPSATIRPSNAEFIFRIAAYLRDNH